MDLSRLFWICFGGAVGTGARYGLSVALTLRYGTGFPWGTLAVNVIGSFLLGAILRVGTTTQLISPTLLLALTTGAMGGFTTYSTFNYETLRFFQERAWRLGFSYVAATLFGCLLAGALGAFAAERIFPR